MICERCHGNRINPQTGMPCEECGGMGSMSCCGDQGACDLTNEQVNRLRVPPSDKDGV